MIRDELLEILEKSNDQTVGFVIGGLLAALDSGNEETKSKLRNHVAEFVSEMSKELGSVNPPKI